MVWVVFNPASKDAVTDVVTFETVSLIVNELLLLRLQHSAENFVNYPLPKGRELLVFASTELLVHGKHRASLAYRQLPQRRVVPTTQLDYGF